MPLFSKIFPALIFWGIFIFVIFQVPYPESLTQAGLVQILAFFISFFLALVITLNLFLKFIPSSVFISLGIISLLLLKALDTLNFVSAVLIFITVGLLLSYFKNEKGKHKLTYVSRISKLTHLPRKKQ